MTPEQALQLLDAAVSGALMSRVQHVRAQEAIRVLAGAIQDEKPINEDQPE